MIAWFGTPLVFEFCEAGEVNAIDASSDVVAHGCANASLCETVGWGVLTVDVLVSAAAG